MLEAEMTVTNAMLEAGERAWTDVLREPDYSAEKRLAAIYTAMHAARPTADLGEDGGLVERLRHHADAHSFFVAALTEHYNRMAEQVGSDPLPERARQSDHAPVMREAADRLILYAGEIEALKHDIRRAQETSSELATENAPYREALAEVQEQVGAYGYGVFRGRRVRQSWAAELLAKIDALLSRSGG